MTAILILTYKQVLGFYVALIDKDLPVVFRDCRLFLLRFVMANNTSQHILSTAANLLGFCLFVITALHISNQEQRTLIDEFTGIVAILLAASSLLSFASIRSQNEKRGGSLENIANLLFLLSLIGILVIIVFITLHFIK